MLIVCPSCATSYQVEPNSLGQGGRSVRCTRCRNTWFATTPALVSTLPGSDSWDVVDNGPRVPSVDRPAEAVASAAAMPKVFPAPEDIDVASLTTDLNSERAEQEAEADAVLAEVAQEAATDSPPLVPAQTATTIDAAASPGPDIETFAATRARRDAWRSGRWLKPGLPALIIILVAINAALIAWRTEVARLFPQTASLYAAIHLPVNLRGLTFEDIRMSRIDQDGLGVLVVEGSIVNVTGRPVEVPRLRIAVRNGAKQEVYAWTALPTRSILQPGDALPFRSRLASPPTDAREVQVRFLTRRDLVAGLN